MGVIMIGQTGTGCRVFRHVAFLGISRCRMMLGIQEKHLPHFPQTVEFSPFFNDFARELWYRFRVLWGECRVSSVCMFLLPDLRSPFISCFLIPQTFSTVVARPLLHTNLFFIGLPRPSLHLGTVPGLYRTDCTGSLHKKQVKNHQENLCVAHPWVPLGPSTPICQWCTT